MKNTAIITLATILAFAGCANQEAEAQTMGANRNYTVTDSAEPQTNPQCKTGRNYVKRGGSNYHSFSSESYLFTTTGRYFYGSTDWTIGMRLCLVK